MREAERPDDLLIMEEDKKGSYIMNSKDLCLVDYLDELREAGVTSFKIEGRAKSVYYVGNTVKVYRDAIDKTKLIKDNVAELKKSQNRGFTAGFLFGKEKCEQKTDASHEKCDWEFCGQVVTKPQETVKTGRDLSLQFPAVSASGHLIKVMVHNQIQVGDEIEFVLPSERNFKYRVKEMYNKGGEKIDEAHGGQGKIIFLAVGRKLPEYTLLRRKV